MEYKFTFEDGSEALEHYGVPGQRWGVRKKPKYVPGVLNRNRKSNGNAHSGNGEGNSSSSKKVKSLGASKGIRKAAKYQALKSKKVNKKDKQSLLKKLKKKKQLRGKTYHAVSGLTAKAAQKRAAANSSYEAITQAYKSARKYKQGHSKG